MINKQFIALSLVLLTCVACAPIGETTRAAQPVAHAHTIKNMHAGIKNCTQRGGVIQKAGIAQQPHCVINYPDAAQACANHTDCLGDCLLVESTLPAGTPVKGQCQRNNLPFGCFAKVNGGIAGPTLCMD